MKPTSTKCAILPIIIFGAMFMVCNENRAYGDSRVGRARMDVKSLEQAVTAYWMRTGEWPPSLQILTERSPDGSPAMLKDESVIFDPWGQPYHYDPKQLSPESGRPLIWTDGSPGNANGKIANWGEGSTYKSPNTVSRLAIAVLIGIVLLFICWALPRSERKQLRIAQVLAGWLLVALVLGAASYFCFVTYTTML